jgi:membrane-bound lytic murein transglycosylase MltF
LPENVDFRDFESGDDALWANVRSYCKTIQTECSKFENLDTTLVATVMYVESRGDSNAISGSNAIGLMQVLPDTELPGRPTKTQLLDPTFNIQTGCQILSSYIEREGSTRNGLWAYNGKGGTFESYADLVLTLYDEVRQ